MFDAANPNFWIAFIAGIVSFISPCCLPLYPAYLSYITGISYEEMHAEQNKSRIRKTALLHSIFFSIGLSIIYVALGFTTGFFGQFFLTFQDLIRQIGGIIIIVMGLFLAGVIKWEHLMKERKFHLKNKPTGYLGSLFVGMAFSAGWTPCIGPILTVVLSIAATDPANGAWLLLAYSLGFAIPFIILAYTLGSVRWILKYSGIVMKVGGWIMALMGLMLVMNWMSLISSYLTQIFGFQGI